MPGIVAIIDSKCDESLVRGMASLLVHDESHKMDLYVKPPIGLARVHLGILNPEQQPIFNEDGTSLIFMDGELFDYEVEKKELEKKGHIFRVDNDAEFCLHLYEEFGDEFVKKLEGSFVLVIVELKNKRLIIANDKHSLRPLFYAKNSGRYIFSSEVKAILRDKTVNKDIDHEAVANYFAFGRILVEEKTFFKEIKLLPPASLAIWEKGNFFVNRYWNINYRENYDLNLTEKYYLDNMVDLWKRAIEKRTKGKHSFGLFLSGGLDSRAIAAPLSQRCHPLRTFTYGIRGGDEAKIAEKIAGKLKTEHKFFDVKSDYLTSFAEKGVYLTDGMVNCAHFWWISLLENVRKDVDVIFHGHGQDILLGTYLYRLKSANVHLDQELLKTDGDAFAVLFYKKLNNLIPEQIMPTFFSEAFYKKIRNVPFEQFKKMFDQVNSTNILNKTDCFYLRSMRRDYWSVIVLRNFLEDRVVGLDSDFLEFAVGIPPALRSKTSLYYKFITRLSADMSKITYQRTGVPPGMPIIIHRIGFLVKGGYKMLVRIIRQKTSGVISLPLKMGYPDIDEWIRKDVKTENYFRSILLDEKTLGREYFNRDFIIRMFNEHKKGSRNWGMQLCALLTFELWHRLFVD